MLSVVDPGILEGGACPKLVATVRRGDGFRKFLKFRFKIVLIILMINWHKAKGTLFKHNLLPVNDSIRFICFISFSGGPDALAIMKNSNH